MDIKKLKEEIAATKTFDDYIKCVQSHTAILATDADTKTFGEVGSVMKACIFLPETLKNEGRLQWDSCNQYGNWFEDNPTGYGLSLIDYFSRYMSEIISASKFSNLTTDKNLSVDKAVNLAINFNFAVEYAMFRGTDEEYGFEPMKKLTDPPY